MASGPITSWQIDAEAMETMTGFIFLASKITSDGDCSHEIKRLAPWKKSYDKPRQCIKKQRHYFANRGWFSQTYGFSSSHIQVWVLDHKEGWVVKNWCFWTVVLEMTLESPLDSMEIKLVNPKENQPWIFIGRTDAEAEAPILWPPDEKSQLAGRDPDPGKDWRQEEKGTEDEIAGWHHQLNGHAFEQSLGVGDGQGSSLVCCSSWGRKESDTTERLNWTKVLAEARSACPGVGLEVQVWRHHLLVTF